MIMNVGSGTQKLVLYTYQMIFQYETMNSFPVILKLSKPTPVRLFNTKKWSVV